MNEVEQLRLSYMSPRESTRRYGLWLVIDRDGIVGAGCAKLVSQARIGCVGKGTRIDKPGLPQRREFECECIRMGVAARKRAVRSAVHKSVGRSIRPSVADDVK